MGAKPQATSTATQSGLISRMFSEHPRSLGMTWASHGIGAVKIGGELVGAGLACIVHAFVPGWFTQTAGKTVERMHAHMAQRKAAAVDPQQWPEYEI